MSGLDQIIVACGMGAFIVFVLAHIMALRCMPAAGILDAVQKLFYFGILALTAAVSFLPGLSVTDKFPVFIFSLCAYGLASFVYVLCIFGPYATSIRLRLISELDAPQGKTMAEISRTYDSKAILDLRLKRLLASGDIRFDGDRYHIAKAHNAFFIIDAGARALHAIMQKS